MPMASIPCRVSEPAPSPSSTLPGKPRMQRNVRSCSSCLNERSGIGCGLPNSWRSATARCSIRSRSSVLAPRGGLPPGTTALALWRGTKSRAKTRRQYQVGGQGALPASASRHGGRARLPVVRHVVGGRKGDPVPRDNVRAKPLRGRVGSPGREAVRQGPRATRGVATPLALAETGIILPGNPVRLPALARLRQWPLGPAPAALLVRAGGGEIEPAAVFIVLGLAARGIHHPVHPTIGVHERRGLIDRRRQVFLSGVAALSPMLILEWR